MIGVAPINLSQATRFAWTVFQKRYVLFTGTLLTAIGAWVVLEMVVVAGDSFGLAWWAAAHAAFLVLFAALELGLLSITLKLLDGGEPRFADVFRDLRRGPIFLIGQVLFSLLVLAGLVVFVIPGVHLAARYGLFGFCMADGQTGLSESFRTSTGLTAGVRMRLAAVVLVLVVFNAFGAALLGVGLFLTIPLSTLTMTAVFRQLSPRRAPL